MKTPREQPRNKSSFPLHDEPRQSPGIPNISPDMPLVVITKACNLKWHHQQSQTRIQELEKIGEPGAEMQLCLEKEIIYKKLKSRENVYNRRK